MDLLPSVNCMAQVRKLRFREVKKQAQGHTADGGEGARI